MPLDFRLLNLHGPANTAAAFGGGAQQGMSPQDQLTMQRLENLKRETAAAQKVSAMADANGLPQDPLKRAALLIQMGRVEEGMHNIQSHFDHVQSHRDANVHLDPEYWKVPSTGDQVQQNQQLPQQQLPQQPNALAAPNANALAAPNANALAQDSPEIMQAKRMMLASSPSVRKMGEMEMNHLLNPPKPAAAIEEFEYAKRNGFKGDFGAFKTLHAPRMTTNVNVPVSLSTEKKYGEKFADRMADSDIEKMGAAEKAPELAANAAKIKDVLKKGNVITGFGANTRLEIARALNVAGSTNSEKVANTELLVSSLSKNVMNSIKSSGLGAGQGFTDADLKFLQGAVGGSISLNKETLTKLADLSEKAAHGSAAAWNNRLAKIPKSALEGTGVTQGVTIPSSKPSAPAQSAAPAAMAPPKRGQVIGSKRFVGKPGQEGNPDYWLDSRLPWKQ